MLQTFNVIAYFKKLKNENGVSLGFHIKWWKFINKSWWLGMAKEKKKKIWEHWNSLVLKRLESNGYRRNLEWNPQRMS